MEIEVAYALPHKQVLLKIAVPVGCTVAAAIERSGIHAEFPDVVIDTGAVGIFSRKVPLDQILREGDRIEIYRPLIADPKEMRKQRARSEVKPD